MHAITFMMKRCHLSAVAVGRRIFRGCRPPEDPRYDGVPDMTPARFDILYLVLGRHHPRSGTPGYIEMAELRRLLGLARSTISEAVKRLVELGLVTCELSETSERNKIVKLTAEGWARLKRALHLVFTGRRLTDHLNRYVNPRPMGATRRPWKPMRAWRIADRLREIRDELEGLAAHLFDRSEQLYEIQGEPEE